MVSRLLGLPDEKGSAGLEAVNTYAIAIQFGAILAVLGLFWKRFRDMVLGLFGKNPDGLHLLITLVIAFLPAAVLGWLFDNEDRGRPVRPVARRRGLDRRRRPDPGAGAHRPDPRPGRPVTPRDGSGSLAITYRQALIIGLAQCVALWPGTSRSLATILGALLVGVSMPAAVEFSFLLGFATLSARRPPSSCSRTAGPSSTSSAS